MNLPAAELAPVNCGARAGGRRLSAHAEAVTAILSRPLNERTGTIRRLKIDSGMINATVPASVVPVPVPALTLRRELVKWDLTAIGINQVIGSAASRPPTPDDLWVERTWASSIVHRRR